jgi:NADPH-dependent 2,4-dienoyl-CoA reductase/sulfur reductase-like enzyme
VSARLDRIVIVGASAAGLTTAESLRHEGFAGDLVLIGEEPHPPYDRPPLSKHVLGGSWSPAQTALRRPERYAELGIDLRLGRRASGVDMAARAVLVDGDRPIRFDGLVIATGLTPRTLSAVGLAGVHVLRTLDHAAALRADLERARSVVVIGAGLLGCEIAATARTMGRAVTVVDAAPTPMLTSLGPRLGPWVADVHRAHGTTMRLSSGVRRVLGGEREHAAERVRAVELLDGTILPCDVLVVAIGAVPATAWLDGAGLTVDDGVVCDQHLAAAPGIYAAGDVARWYDPRVGRTARVEHRMNATEQGRAVARNMLGAGASFTPVPYFWSDQYDVKIQVFGELPAGAETTVVAGDPHEPRFVMSFREHGRVAGVVGVNMPRAFHEARSLVANEAVTV